VTWEEAADLLERLLEETARIIDGEEVDEAVTDLGSKLEGTPSPELAERVGHLLQDVELALEAAALRRAEIHQDLNHTERLKTAGAEYLRY